ncbi:hypothetical protein FHP25_20065 [Vineibacter terrae]|uniref:DUF5801 domain-containing protein n=1 Tax=Vineibacter terrae TaxID=2586908 RepID=A0A5C8PJX8_9HYPH|nr:DUF5801 repeats-in-toxin domain-containing protein [Vineibacter terrae]TXL73706.1 hypothetical protein FHP25_20065 [Vineibacter terrae]
MAPKDITTTDDLTIDPLATADPLTISTDRADYAPGDTVTISLSGIKAGATYTFQIQDLPSDPGDNGKADIYKPFTVTDGGKGDLDGAANGQIVTTWTVPHNNDAVNATLSLTATGADGSKASTTFTDAPPASTVSVRLDQWADGPAPDADGTGGNNEVFVNGNLNQTKAHYNEGDSVPYRAFLDDLNTGTVYGIQIQWDTVDSGAYALDYLTSFNFSFEGTRHPGEPDVTPTVGITDISSGAISTVNIPSDPQLLTGFGAQFGVTDGLGSGQPSGQQVFTIFGAVSNLSTSAITYNADHTKASITVFFTYNGSTANNADSVVVAWGGHIASSLDWRDDPGETVQTASDISGSPYHTRVLTLFENGVATSIGNQDRSLSAAAVEAPPVANDISLLADEDNITGGNNDVQAGDDAQANLTGTLPVTNATSVNFADLHLDPVLNTSSAPVTSGGAALTFFWDGGSGTLFASTNTSSLANAQASAVFKIQVAASSPFTYTFTLLDQVDHPAANGTADDNTENPNILVDLTYTAVGVGTDTGVIHVTLDDDIPIVTAAQQTGTVDEDGVPGGIAGGVGDVAGEATVATGSVAPLFSPGADQPLTFSLSADTSGLAALTSGGVAVTYAVVGNTLTASAGGSTVFTFSVNSTTGAWTFTLSDQLDHAAGNDENDLTINLSSILRATDFDGDTAAAAANALVVTVDDDTPTASQASQTGTVDEDGVPGGIAGGVGDVAGEATVATGSVTPLFNSGADQPLTFSLSADTSGLAALTSGGVAVTYAVVGNTLTASAGGSTVFTFSVNGSTGDWTFTLSDQLDHATGNDENDLTINLSSILRATDFDGDTVAAAANALIVTVDDDTPTASQASSTGTVDEDGVTGGIAGGVGDVAGEATVATGSVTPLFNSGADQPLTFSLSTDTSNLAALTSGGVAVTYAVVGNTLTASAGANTVFTFSLNGTTGDWTFTLVDQLDHATGNDENDITINLSSILRATDFDGDTVAAAANALVVTVDDDTPTASQASSTGTVDEDGVPGGIAGGVGDVAGEATVATGSVTPLFNSGADQPLTFSLSADTSGLAALTSGGVAVTYAVVGNTLTASAGANTVFTFSLNGTTGDWTFTLADQLDHATGNDENALAINLSSILRATDFDGDTVAAAANALIVTVDDDTPTASQASQTGTVDEDGVPGGIAGGVGDVAGEATVATGSVTPLFNPGADQPLTFSLSTDTSNLAALTSGGVAVTYAVVGNTLTASAGANTVFTFSLNGTTGDWTFTLVDQLDHATGNGENDLAVNLSSILRATDFDGDTVAAAANALIVTVDDDTPTASQASSTGTVDEDGVPGGIAGGVGDVAGEATVATGSVTPLFNSGADQPLTFSLSADTSGLAALTSGGVAVTYAVVGNTLTASAGANTVFTFSLNGTTGDWTFTLVDQLDHAAGNDENDLAVNLSSILRATDFDGDVVAAAANALVVTVDDDSPVPLTPAILSVSNAASATANAALGAFNHVGADQPGSSVFIGLNGSVLQGAIQDGTPTLENLKAGGSDIFLFGFGTSTLIATTDATNTDVAQRVFTMGLNPDGSVQANDLYSINMLRPVDNLVDVGFGNFTAAPASGNPLTLVVNDIGGSTIDALFSGFVDQSNNSSTQTTVNVSGAGVGVGTGQDFDFDPQTASATDDLTDRMRIQFLADDGDGILETGEARTVNRFTFIMNQNNPPGDDGDALIRVYNATGAEVQITGILVNGATLVGAGGAPVPSHDPSPGGNVTATANGLGYELHGLGGGTSGSTADNDTVTIITAAGYQRIDIAGIGNDSNKDTFDILLQSVAVPTPFDIVFNTQANLTDFDGDSAAASQLEVHLLA